MATNGGEHTPIRTHYIYSLLDPRDGTARYIGRTCDPKRRLSQHCAPERLAQSAKADWVRELRDLGLRPRLRILETIAADRARLNRLADKRGYKWNGGPSPLEYALDDIVSAREEYWMAQALALGWPLLNGPTGEHIGYYGATPRKAYMAGEEDNEEGNR
ncbi:MAG: GIY-YIG nuclease family protein [Chloroflexota bacterium]|nr:GIY-YIG nuclease family protein [Chloroflexota bacterium]